MKGNAYIDSLCAVAFLWPDPKNDIVLQFYYEPQLNTVSFSSLNDWLLYYECSMVRVDNGHDDFDDTTTASERKI